jgi:putative flippase GtrA
MTTPVESMVERFVAMAGLACAISGPIIALIISGFILPWYAVVAVLAIILAGIVISYWMFRRGAHSVEDVSISPEHGAETTR